MGDRGRRSTWSGVAGQRDSSGSGTDGYRVLPRQPGDVIGQTPPAASPTPTPSARRPVAEPVRLAGQRGRHADRRGAGRGDGHAPAHSRRRDAPDRPARRADGRRAGRDRRDPPSPRRRTRASSALGQRVEVDGQRVDARAAWNRCASRSRPARSARRRSPAAREMRTGDAGEAEEARAGGRARARSSASARRSSSGTVSFEIDDGSGPLRVSHPGAPARRPRSAQRGHVGRGARRARPGDQRIEAERGLPSLATRPPRRCGSPRRSPAAPPAARGRARRDRVRRRRRWPDRLARRPRDRGPLTAADRRDPRRRSVEGDARRRAALGRCSPGCRPRVVGAAASRD